ncbi:hypothetical protein E3P78_02865 [Wallemia ichthyophaga]|nr:hypothetical protein E3P78_02865 [Wallemia ichthyophaga]
MNASSQRQRILVEEQITNTNNDTATRFLKLNGWRFDDALDEYFANPPIQVNKSALTKLWNKYKDSDDENVMSVPDGLIEYGADLDVDLTSMSALALAQLCGATLQAEHWPKQSWISGWSGVGGDTLDKQKDYVHSAPTKLSQDRQFFNKVYAHTFEMGKGQGARILSLEDAKAYWSILLAPHLPDEQATCQDTHASLNKDSGEGCQFTKQMLDGWIEYLEQENVAVTKDTWLEFLNFVRSINADFSNFDDTAAWPSLIDDFVEHTQPNPQSIETCHQDAIHDAQLDYYGKRLATASSDGTIKITDISQAAESTYGNSNAASLRGHQGPVWQVAWAHPNYGSILASSSYDGKVFIWKQEQGNSWTRIKDHTLHTSSVNSISWAPHELGPTLACASSDGNVSVLTFHKDGTWEASILAAHKLGVSSVSWAPATSPNDVAGLTSRLVTGGCDSLVKIWSFKWWQCDESIGAHTDWVRDVAWSPNVGLSKQYLASASQDRSVFIHTQDTPRSPWTSTKLNHDFKDTVWRLSWSLSGNVLAASAGDGQVTLWKENLENVFELIHLPLVYSYRMRNIMIAWTLDPAAEIAFDYYRSTIAMPEDVVHLVNVKQTSDLNLQLHNKAQKLQLDLEGVSTHVSELSGDVASALIDHANSTHPDLVLVGRRNLGHWERLTSEQGFSLSSHLSTHILSPVIVVKFARN